MDEDESQRIEVSAARVLDVLSNGEMHVEAAMPYSSNYTLLTMIEQADIRVLAIYKPKRGERPLWDFPRGTLYRREVAAFIVSEVLGFHLVPPTVVRDGPYGVGAVQLFVENDDAEHLFTMQKGGGYEQEIFQLTAFDCLINNADRKSGHCLKGLDGRMWAIDHGISFHYEYKLRTVLWDLVGVPFPADVREALCTLREQLEQRSPALAALEELLDKSELRALRRRLNDLLATGVYPEPGPGPNIPWPMV